MQTIRVTSSGPVTTVTLDRPEARNAFNAATIGELHAFFSDIDPAVRAVILTGAGAIFCAGADIGWMKESGTYTPEENERDALAMARMLRTIDECPCPVLARINGHCLGGGMGLIGACDINVAVDSALFGYTEVRLGVEPAIISPFSLPKIGVRNARRYFVTGERFDAREAYRIGLLHEVVTHDQLDATIEKIIRELMYAAPGAVREAKALIRKIDTAEREEAERISAHAIASLRAAPEGQEGMAAFLEKRRPAWVPDALR